MIWWLWSVIMAQLEVSESTFMYSYDLPGWGTADAQIKLSLPLSVCLIVCLSLSVFPPPGVRGILVSVLPPV